MKPISPEIEITGMSSDELVELGKKYRAATHVALRLDDEKHHHTYPVRDLTYMNGCQGRIRFMKPKDR